MRRMPADPGLVVGPSLVVPRAELSWRFSRSSGPGGQGVNTADSRAALSWDLVGSAVLSPGQRERLVAHLGTRLVEGVLTVTASEHREQLRNRAAAEVRLVALVAAGLAPPARPRRPTRPTRGSVERRLTAKRRRSETKRSRSGRDGG